MRSDDGAMWEGELAYIFAVKGTFIHFLHRPDIFDINGAVGIFPWGEQVILLGLHTNSLQSQQHYCLG